MGIKLPVCRFLTQKPRLLADDGYVFFMSATLSGPIVLENPRPVSGSSRTIEFDGQMWMSTGYILTGRFCSTLMMSIMRYNCYHRCTD